HRRSSPPQDATFGNLTVSTRRDFFKWTAAALGPPLLATSPAAGESPATAPATATGSDVGSLFPFIQSQAVKADFPLSCRRDEFGAVAGGRRRARGKLMELLHYAPPVCEPQPELVERVDKGDYVREKITFRTTPDIRVPAYVLVPKGLSKP